MLWFLNIPTPDRVYKECVSQNLLHPEIVTAQSILETGWYKHFKGHNIFGLYNSSKHDYYQFACWQQSVGFYKEQIQDKYYKGQDYYEFLDCMWKNKKGECRRYAGAKNYTNTLKQIKWKRNN